jgi:hypothetical protein
MVVLPITLQMEMTTIQPHDEHTHEPMTVRVIVLRAGVPYETEQQVCATCLRVLDEKPVRRAAA